MSPIVQIYGLPRLNDAEIAAPANVDVHLGLSIVSNYSTDTAGTESIILDGETYRYDLTVRRGITKRWEAGIILPFIRHSGGHFDSFIESFHDLFGLPQGGRLQAPHDRLLFDYVKGGQSRVHVSSPASGIGDMRIVGGYRLTAVDGKGKQAVLRLMLKLPTGDADTLLGSGSTDFALHLQGCDRSTLAAFNTTWYGGAGFLLLTEGEVLPEQQRNIAAFATLGIGWQPYDFLLFKVQFDGHTPFYQDSSLEQLSTMALQVTLGGSIGFSGGYVLDIGVVEDLVLDTVPDVTFHFNLRKQF